MALRPQLWRREVALPVVLLMRHDSQRGELSGEIEGSVEAHRRRQERGRDARDNSRGQARGSRSESVLERGRDCE